MDKKKEKVVLMEKLQEAFYRAGAHLPYTAWPTTADALWFGYQYALKRKEALWSARQSFRQLACIAGR